MIDRASQQLLRDDSFCFGCGRDNPIGLRLTFDWDGDTYLTRYVPEREHQGWAGRTHGGILALILDELLSRAALERHGMDWVTAELSTRLLRPAPIGRPLVGRGRIVSVRSRLIVCQGEVSDEETGQIVASGEAKLMRPRG